MAVQKTVRKVSLKLGLDNGMDNGKQKIKNKTFNKVRVNVNEDSLYKVGNSLSSLYEKDLVELVKVEESTLKAE